MSTEFPGFYPFYLKRIQLNFERFEKHLIVGKAEGAFRCQLTVDSLTLSSMVGCCPKCVMMMLYLHMLFQEYLLFLQMFTYP